MPAFKAIVEGDSQLAVLQRFSKAGYPGRIANWLEEIRSISASAFLSFHHVVRDCNSKADDLARAGASRTDLAFDL